SRRRHTRFSRDWSSDVCSSDLGATTRPTCASWPSTGDQQRAESDPNEPSWSRTSGNDAPSRVPTSIIDVHNSPDGTRMESPSHRSEEHTSELQSRENLVCRLLL